MLRKAGHWWRYGNIDRYLKRMYFSVCGGAITLIETYNLCVLELWSTSLRYFFPILKICPVHNALNLDPSSLPIKAVYSLKDFPAPQKHVGGVNAGGCRVIGVWYYWSLPNKNVF